MKHLAGVCPTCKHHARLTNDREWERSNRYRCAGTTMRDLGDGKQFEDICLCLDPFHANISGWRHPNKDMRRQK
ncbi:Uncharacterised protein [uncultured archaeon]|nr:Uncharacterised protein [uncultured archaeon]